MEKLELKDYIRALGALKERSKTGTRLYGELANQASRLWMESRK